MMIVEPCDLCGRRETHRTTREKAKRLEHKTIEMVRMRLGPNSHWVRLQETI
ncbi:MAG: hypothetical protein K0Q87_459 [Neobacillus sp.]|nr:hypothetical protein [Neobacillus sp.]